MLSFHVEKKKRNLGLELSCCFFFFFFFKGEAQGGHATSCSSLAHCQGASGTWHAGRRQGWVSLPTVLGSHLCWQGLAIKHWPPWQPRSVVLSDEECRAPGSVLNTS